MKCLIIYDSKRGCTEDCAKYISSKLTNVDLVNLKKQKAVNLSVYDVIIIGSPIYIGTFSKTIRNFTNENANVLLTKELYFIMCGTNDKKEVLDEVIKRNIPEQLVQHAKSIDFIGGEIRLDKLNFLEKMMIKMVEKKEGKIEANINYKTIDNFINKIILK